MAPTDVEKAFSHNYCRDENKVCEQVSQKYDDYLLKNVVLSSIGL